MKHELYPRQIEKLLGKSKEEIYDFLTKKLDAYKIEENSLWITNDLSVIRILFKIESKCDWWIGVFNDSYKDLELKDHALDPNLDFYIFDTAGNCRNCTDNDELDLNHKVYIDPLTNEFLTFDDIPF